MTGTWEFPTPWKRRKPNSNKNKKGDEMKNETKTYHVKHEFGHTEISLPEEGYTVNLNINITFQTLSFLLIIIGIIGLIATYLIQLIVK